MRHGIGFQSASLSPENPMIGPGVDDAFPRDCATGETSRTFCTESVDKLAALSEGHRCLAR